MNRGLIVLSFFLLQAYSSNAQPIETMKKFNIPELLQLQKQGQRPWKQFLDEPTIEAGIYHLNAGEPDRQPVHEFDEIYYILNGNATLQAADTSIIVSPGSTIYVKAQVPHHFNNIKKDLDVLVLFPKAEFSPADPKHANYFLNTIREKAGKDTVVWTVFHNSKTMMLGLYTLPRRTGGDSTLVHKVDELNIVTKGTAKFSVDGKDIDVKEGDIIYVTKGKGHYFHNLKSDLEVMILFEKKSIQKPD